VVRGLVPVFFFFFFGFYLYDADDDCTRVRTHAATGRFEYADHVEYHHVYAAHLLEKHAPDANQQGFAVRLVGQHFRQRVGLRPLLFDERLYENTRAQRDLRIISVVRGGAVIGRHSAVSADCRDTISPGRVETVIM